MQATGPYWQTSGQIRDRGETAGRDAHTSLPGTLHLHASGSRSLPEAEAVGQGSCPDTATPRASPRPPPPLGTAASPNAPRGSEGGPRVSPRRLPGPPVPAGSGAAGVGPPRRLYLSGCQGNGEGGRPGTGHQSDKFNYRYRGRPRRASRGFKAGD